MKVDTVTKESILDFLRKNKTLLKKEFDVDNIMLYGSYARDEQTDESDIDILIKSKVKSFDKLYQLKLLLEKNFKKKVDLFYFDSIHPFIMQFIEEDLVYA